jgi:hypothetical protein
VKRNDHVIWIGLGIGIAVIGFLFTDSDSYGILGRIVAGTVFGIPYRYVLSFAVALALYGAYLWTRKTST